MLKAGVGLVELLVLTFVSLMAAPLVLASAMAALLIFASPLLSAEAKLELPDAEMLLAGATCSGETALPFSGKSSGVKAPGKRSAMV